MKALLLALAVMVAAAAADTQTVDTQTGTACTQASPCDWGVAGTWVAGTGPNTLDRVVIPSGAYVYIASAVTITDLEAHPPSGIEFRTGGALLLTGQDPSAATDVSLLVTSPTLPSDKFELTTAVAYTVATPDLVTFETHGDVTINANMELRGLATASTNSLWWQFASSTNDGSGTSGKMPRVLRFGDSVTLGIQGKSQLTSNGLPWSAYITGSASAGATIAIGSSAARVAGDAADALTAPNRRTFDLFAVASTATTGDVTLRFSDAGGAYVGANVNGSPPNGEITFAGLVEVLQTPPAPQAPPPPPVNFIGAFAARGVWFLGIAAIYAANPFGAGVPISFETQTGADVVFQPGVVLPNGFAQYGVANTVSFVGSVSNPIVVGTCTFQGIKSWAGRVRALSNAVVSLGTNVVLTDAVDFDAGTGAVLSTTTITLASSNAFTGLGSGVRPRSAATLTIKGSDPNNNNKVIAGIWDVPSGTTLELGAGLDVSEPSAITGAGTIRLNGCSIRSRSSSGSALQDFWASSQLTISGPNTGLTTTIIFSDPTDVITRSAFSWTGTLRLTNEAGQFAVTTATMSGADLVVGKQSLAFGSTSTLRGTIRSDTSAVLAATDDLTWALSGVVDTQLSVVKDGGRSVTLTSASALTGTGTLALTNVQLAAAGVVADSTPIRVSPPSTVTLLTGSTLFDLSTKIGSVEGTVAVAGSGTLQLGTGLVFGAAGSSAKLQLADGATAAVTGNIRLLSGAATVFMTANVASAAFSVAAPQATVMLIADLNLIGSGTVSFGGGLTPAGLLTRATAGSTTVDVSDPTTTVTFAGTIGTSAGSVTLAIGNNGVLTPSGSVNVQTLTLADGSRYAPNAGGTTLTAATITRLPGSGGVVTIVAPATSTVTLSPTTFNLAGRIEVTGPATSTVTFAGLVTAASSSISTAGPNLDVAGTSLYVQLSNTGTTAVAFTLSGAITTQSGVEGGAGLGSTLAIGAGGVTGDILQLSNVALLTGSNAVACGTLSVVGDSAIRLPRDLSTTRLDLTGTLTLDSGLLTLSAAGNNQVSGSGAVKTAASFATHIAGKLVAPATGAFALSDHGLGVTGGATFTVVGGAGALSGAIRLIGATASTVVLQPGAGGFAGAISDDATAGIVHVVDVQGVVNAAATVALTAGRVQFSTGAVVTGGATVTAATLRVDAATTFDLTDANLALANLAFGAGALTVTVTGTNARTLSLTAAAMSATATVLSQGPSVNAGLATARGTFSSSSSAVVMLTFSGSAVQSGDTLLLASTSTGELQIAGGLNAVSGGTIQVSGAGPARLLPAASVSIPSGGTLALGGAGAGAVTVATATVSGAGSITTYAAATPALTFDSTANAVNIAPVVTLTGSVRLIGANGVVFQQTVAVPTNGAVVPTVTVDATHPALAAAFGLAAATTTLKLGDASQALTAAASPGLVVTGPASPGAALDAASRVTLGATGLATFGVSVPDGVVLTGVTGSEVRLTAGTFGANVQSSPIKFVVPNTNAATISTADRSMSIILELAGSLTVAGANAFGPSSLTMLSTAVLATSADVLVSTGSYQGIVRCTSGTPQVSLTGTTPAASTLTFDAPAACGTVLSGGTLTAGAGAVIQVGGTDVNAEVQIGGMGFVLNAAGTSPRLVLAHSTGRVGLQAPYAAAKITAGANANAVELHGTMYLYGNGASSLGSYPVRVTSATVAVLPQADMTFAGSFATDLTGNPVLQFGSATRALAVTNNQDLDVLGASSQPLTIAGSSNVLVGTASSLYLRTGVTVQTGATISGPGMLAAFGCRILYDGVSSTITTARVQGPPTGATTVIVLSGATTKTLPAFGSGSGWSGQVQVTGSGTLQLGTTIMSALTSSISLDGGANVEFGSNSALQGTLTSVSAGSRFTLGGTGSTIGADGLTLNNALATIPAGALSIGNALTLAGTTDVTGALEGTGSVTTSGSGTITLRPTASFTIATLTAQSNVALVLSTPTAITIPSLAVSAGDVFEVQGGTALTLTTVALASDSTLRTLVAPVTVNGGSVDGTLASPATGTMFTLTGVTVSSSAVLALPAGAVLALGAGVSLPAWMPPSANNVELSVTGNCTFGATSNFRVTLRPGAFVTYRESTASHSLDRLRFFPPCGLSAAATGSAPQLTVASPIAADWVGATPADVTAAPVLLDGVEVSKTSATGNGMNLALAPGVNAFVFSRGAKLTVTGITSSSCATCTPAGSGSGATLLFAVSDASTSNVLTHAGTSTFTNAGFSATPYATVEVRMCFSAPDVQVQYPGLVHTQPAVCDIPPYDGCASNPCSPAGTSACTNFINPNRYVCTCLAGFAGALCETNNDECASSPCLNGATCRDGINSFTCDCAGGWAGAHCESPIDECASGPCANGGTCHDGQNGYTCDCAAGWSGVRCASAIDECASGPCQNGGTCVDAVASYSCTCVGGFSGLQCQSAIDECASGPCANGGTCHDGLNGYTCDCVAGWSGARCASAIDECASAPCVNGGTCTDGQNGYTCACVAGFSGLQCQSAIDECASAPCANGGTCVDRQNAFECQCATGFSGPQCLVVASSTGASSSASSSSAIAEPTLPTGGVRLYLYFVGALSRFNATSLAAFGDALVADLASRYSYPASRFSIVQYVGVDVTAAATQGAGGATRLMGARRRVVVPQVEGFRVSVDVAAAATGEPSAEAIAAAIATTPPTGTIGGLAVSGTGVQRTCPDGSVVTGSASCPVPTPRDDSGDDNVLSTPAIIGIIVGCAGFLVLIILVVACAPPAKPKRDDGPNARVSNLDAIALAGGAGHTTDATIAHPQPQPMQSLEPLQPLQPSAAAYAAGPAHTAGVELQPLHAAPAPAPAPAEPVAAPTQYAAAPAPAAGDLQYTAPAPAAGDLQYTAPAPAAGDLQYTAPAPAAGDLQYTTPAPAAGDLYGAQAAAPAPMVPQSYAQSYASPSLMAAQPVDSFQPLVPAAAPPQPQV